MVSSGRASRQSRSDNCVPAERVRPADRLARLLWVRTVPCSGVSPMNTLRLTTLAIFFPAVAYGGELELKSTSLLTSPAKEVRATRNGSDWSHNVDGEANANAEADDA